MAGPLDLQFLPPTVSAYDEIRSIYRLRGGPHIISGAPSLLSGSGGSGAAVADEAPKLIPAIIHQTYKSAKVPPAVRPFMQVRATPLHLQPLCTSANHAPSGSMSSVNMAKAEVARATRKQLQTGRACTCAAELAAAEPWVGDTLL